MMNSRTASPRPAYRVQVLAVLHHPTARDELPVDLDPGARFSGEEPVLGDDEVVAVAESGDLPGFGRGCSVEVLLGEYLDAAGVWSVVGPEAPVAAEVDRSGLWPGRTCTSSRRVEGAAYS
jgi:hypothetical protein